MMLEQKKKKKHGYDEENKRPLHFSQEIKPANAVITMWCKA